MCVCESGVCVWSVCVFLVREEKRERNKKVVVCRVCVVRETRESVVCGVCVCGCVVLVWCVCVLGGLCASVCGSCCCVFVCEVCVCFVCVCVCL